MLPSLARSSEKSTRALLFAFEVVALRRLVLQPSAAKKEGDCTGNGVPAPRPFGTGFLGRGTAFLSTPETEWRARASHDACWCLPLDAFQSEAAAELTFLQKGTRVGLTALDVTALDRVLLRLAGIEKKSTGQKMPTVNLLREGFLRGGGGKRVED